MEVGKGVEYFSFASDENFFHAHHTGERNSFSPRKTRFLTCDHMLSPACFPHLKSKSTWKPHAMQMEGASLARGLNGRRRKCGQSGTSSVCSLAALSLAGVPLLCLAAEGFVSDPFVTCSVCLVCFKSCNTSVCYLPCCFLCIL